MGRIGGVGQWRIVLFDQKEHLGVLMADLSLNAPIKFIVFPNIFNGWGIYSVVFHSGYRWCVSFSVFMVVARSFNKLIPPPPPGTSFLFHWSFPSVDFLFSISLAFAFHFLLLRLDLFCSLSRVLSWELKLRLLKSIHLVL